MLTTTDPEPEILLVIGGVFPPSSRVNVIVILRDLPAEIPLHVVLAVTFTVPGTCFE